MAQPRGHPHTGRAQGTPAGPRRLGAARIRSRRRAGSAPGSAGRFAAFLSASPPGAASTRPVPFALGRGGRRGEGARSGERRRRGDPEQPGLCPPPRAPRGSAPTLLSPEAPSWSQALRRKAEGAEASSPSDPCCVRGQQAAARAAQSHIQPGLGCLRGWGIHSLLGRPVPARNVQNAAFSFASRPK